MPQPAHNPIHHDACIRDLLGYLNFSDGSPNGRFRECMNGMFREQLAPNGTPEHLQRYLTDQARTLEGGPEAAFADLSRASRAIDFVLNRLLPAYRQHHQHLLAHLTDSELFTPFFVTQLFEAALSAGLPTDSSDEQRCLSDALGKLNYFLGYRPVAVLENGRRMQPYDHERFCPIPLYYAEGGVACGPYEELIGATLTFIRSLSDSLTGPSYFSIDRLSELCLDVRAHDHLHPVNKRTNYVFGEWDPEWIDTKGFYRRFVIRALILDSLQQWVSAESSRSDDRLLDAASVLAGTILMASAISGSGPQTFNSSTSLSTLLPIVARHRDTFYQELLDTSTGERGKRLRRLAKKSRQPFGHVRHELNMQLAKYGADQVQRRHLSWIYATMGFEEAACEEANVIPCVSARFESGIQSHLVTIRRSVRQGCLERAGELVQDVIRLLHDGIECGGLVDPWNILGFQGQFPLFFSREDSIPDNRVDVLLDIMEQLFDTCSLVMSEAAALGRTEIHDVVRDQFLQLAEQWDQYATTTVHDLTHIDGVKSVTAATQVARALAEWRTAGEAAGDISFWKQHVGEFDSPGSFAQVVGVLLDRRDHLAALGLLLQWLSRADEVRLESGSHSIHSLFHRMLYSICEDPDVESRWQMLRRLFSWMEANAGEFWTVPSLADFVNRQRNRKDSENSESGDLDLEHLFDSEDADEDDLFNAAYDDVIYRDSANDGNASDTVDDGPAPGSTEFEQIYRQVEPRLKFLHCVGSLWGIAAVAISRMNASGATHEDQREHLRDWLVSIRGTLKGLGDLVCEVRDYEIQQLSANLESNIEYDIQMQCRFLLMQNALSTSVEFVMAERLIQAVLGEKSDDETASLDAAMAAMFKAVFGQDPDGAARCFPRLVRELKRRPLLYVPFENGGQPSAILKARVLQSVIRILLSQLPRLGLLEETFVLVQTALEMERTTRPLGQAVTEFDRLFRIGLSTSVEAILQSSAKWRTDASGNIRNVFRRIQRLMDAYTQVWRRHSGSMRLSINEDLHDEDYASVVRDFIAEYGEDLFHTRMLTLGNARAIIHNGADLLLDELEESVAPHTPVKLLDDIEMGVIGRDEAAELAEFVYEVVVENFDCFLEYNTTTTHSDYGDRLYCLLDFVRLESLYDRFDWSYIPWQIVHETLCQSQHHELAAIVEEHLTDETRSTAESFVEDLEQLEAEYGVRLPTLHDHICERIVGTLVQNRMAGLVRICCRLATADDQSELQSHFTQLRSDIEEYMGQRIGSGIEPPEWMQQLATEVQRLHEYRAGILSEALQDGQFTPFTQKSLDKQLAAIVGRAGKTV
ncbi:MAG: hypothetical protein KDA96_08940 [Planctomycetaceae bacterium]|nr:hypothetical protein [Planctomycetaceae bacterium]